MPNDTKDILIQDLIICMMINPLGPSKEEFHSLLDRAAKLGVKGDRVIAYINEKEGR